jgi:hypothetical protein
MKWGSAFRRGKVCDQGMNEQDWKRVRDGDKDVVRISESVEEGRGKLSRSSC